MSLTVLHSTYADKNLAKTLTWDGEIWHKRDHDKVFFHDIVPADDVDDLEELSASLMVLEAFPEACIIRGKLTAGTPDEAIRRLSVDDDSGTDDGIFGATFEDQPLRWVMIDIDDLEADPSWTPAQRIARIISTLPPAFRGADFHLQWSSRAGLDGWKTIRAHLWFWLSEPVTSADLKARAKDERWKEDHGVDTSLLQTVQIHYTAAPVFKGADDPLQGERSQLVRLNRQEVTLPPWTPSVEEYRPTGQHTPFEIDSPVTEARITKWVEAVVNRRCQSIIDAANGEQNAKIYSAARMLGQLVGGGILDHQSAEEALSDAAAAGHHPRDRAKPTIKQGLKRGMREPIYGPPPLP